jgi:predicted DNA-binding transcriptional regulator YafY
MPRNAEVIRQWTILREIEGARGAGVTIDDLAARCAVSTRTIRRDLQALEEAGFPLFDDKSRDDGRTRWTINGQAFRTITAGLTVAELSALYFSRSLLEALAGTPFREDLESAFDKLASGLTPHMRRFLDRFPSVIVTKSDPARRRIGPDTPPQSPLVARALEAMLHMRQATLTYHSRSSDRVKTYVVHPYRLAYAQGGLYLLAFVPEYHEVRTFAIERVLTLSLLDDTFTPIDTLPAEAFPHSLGVHSGDPERIEIEFDAAIADYVQARTWHVTQRIAPLADGGIRVTLDVCRDHALRSWILSFGPFARVIAPPALAQDIAARFDEARARYD